MADLRDRIESSPDHDEEDSLDEDEDDTVEEGDDDIDASICTSNHNIRDFEYELEKKYHKPREYSMHAEDHKKKIEKQKSETKQVKRTERHIFCGVAFLISVLVALFFTSTHSIADSSKNETELYQSKINLIKELEKNIDSISQTFKKQSPEIWVDFIAGIAEVVKYQDRPAIFILFANQDDTMLCLAKMVANASKAALGSDNNLWLSASDIGSDYGMVINKFKNKIEEQKVVIVDNLLNIDSKAMLAFHHLCDKENPLVKKAVYIITMVAEGYSTEQKPIQFVETQLRHKMKDAINEDKLQPLITRITDGPIIPILPEPDFRSCPLRY
ncbi:uncharacterized protein TORIP isoform X2 [Chelonus insularis]|nr:uncharacterized protein LOC118064973 isoform X2 [Chelonus insularis]XP_034935847.1 uncharacterized protein LOC118064973 isoform X2 [Chelonus insularis]XP_034935848.1 uncharacterized protein LOC118064973 isoform X2 [Chelonus insularis]